MANKALAKRQKLSFRVEPSQRSLKPRNLVVTPAKQRVAGPNKKSGAATRAMQAHSFKKALADPDQR